MNRVTDHSPRILWLSLLLGAALMGAADCGGPASSDPQPEAESEPAKYTPTRVDLDAIFPPGAGRDLVLQQLPKLSCVGPYRDPANGQRRLAPQQPGTPRSRRGTARRGFRDALPVPLLDVYTRAAGAGITGGPAGSLDNVLTAWALPSFGRFSVPHPRRRRSQCPTIPFSS